MSLFWSFMADGLGLERSKRVFGFVAVGGTAGAWLGSAITGTLVGLVGRAPLLLISAVFLEVAIACAIVLARRFPRPDAGPERKAASAAATVREAEPGRPAARVPSPGDDPAVEPPRPGGSILGGIALTVRSPYLLAVAGYLLLYSLTSTFAYFEQASIVADESVNRTVRVTLFARIDFWVNLVTLVTQLFVTGRLIRRLGTGWTLAALPLTTAAGFLALGLAPTLTVLMVFQVVRRTSNYALAKPARETLFAILDRNGTYKAKNFLDTFVRRGGDAIGAGLYSVLARVGVGLAGVAFLAIPVALVWAGLALFLGREQGRRATDGRPGAVVSGPSAARTG
jgi:AAA family ATP:ADP antiporter